MLDVSEREHVNVI